VRAAMAMTMTIPAMRNLSRLPLMVAVLVVLGGQ
jgi:hypothetical protein